MLNNRCQTKCLPMRIAFVRLIVALLIAGGPAVARAALFASWSGSDIINESTGVAYPFTLSSTRNSITSISVAFTISGGYNGDLYAYLSHDAGFSVLLNRVGRTAVNTDGFSTPGFVVTLSTSASGDIHNYESLSPIYNGNGQITGTWAADGRDVLPDAAYDTTPRTAGLDTFNTLNPNGDWTIYFFDASPGGVSTLESWSVNVSADVNAVPEPVNAALGVCGGIFTTAALFRMLRRKTGA